MRLADLVTTSLRVAETRSRSEKIASLLQESPIYPGGMALRFARVKRYREDKPASEANTIGTVRGIFAGGWD